MKRFIMLLIIVNMLLACSPQPSTELTSASSPSTSFRVAMLLPRTIDADGWNRSGYRGLLLIQEELGAEIAYTEAIPEDEFEAVFQQYAEEGYDFIIGHGGQFIDAAEIVAAEYPRTRFAITSVYEGNNSNLGSFSLRFSEVAYLTGLVAALKTESQHVAFISGERYRTNEEIAYAFELGVKSTNPNIEVSLVWTDSWTDESIARETTQQLMDAHADVILVVAGQVAPMIHQMAEASGVYTIGWSQDQYDTAPNSVLVSVIENFPSVMLEGATLARRGQWEGQQYLFGMSENALSFTSFRGSLTPAQEAIFEDTKNAILAGEIDTIPES